jgi:hypothetical protein
MLPVADRLRALTGPDVFDVRTSRLVIITRVWTGGRRGADAPPGEPRYRDTRLELPQIYKMRELSSREIASSGGRYEQGDVRVGPITPRFVDPDGVEGGFTEEQLQPTVTRNGTEILYAIEGVHAGEYQLVDLQSMRAFGYAITLRRRTTTP